MAEAKTEQTRRELDAARDRARGLHPFGTALRARVRDPQAAAVAAHRELEAARRALRVWAAAVVDRRTEAWVPGGDGNFGAWVPIADEPEELVERRYPLRLLTAPAANPDHPARDGTIYWGTVPTASTEMNRDGSARFTELGTYELRAFVRMRGCGDCPGPLVWSAPSEPYRLASFHDPEGCAQRPVEVRLPDFAQLEASNAMPSVKMSSPPGSSFVFAEDGQIPTSGSVRSGEDFCFFAIPLITIIATFVLKLFLPIVTLLFGLFWMLKLKFCIPPSLQLEADLKTELDLVPGGIQASLTLDIDVQAGVNKSALEGVLRTGLDTDRPGQQLGTKLTSKYTNDPVVELLARQAYGVPAASPSRSSGRRRSTPRQYAARRWCTRDRHSRPARFRLGLPGAAATGHRRPAVRVRRREGARVDPAGAADRAGGAGHAADLRLRAAPLPRRAEHRRHPGADHARRDRCDRGRGSRGSGSAR